MLIFVYYRKIAHAQKNIFCRATYFYKLLILMKLCEKQATFPCAKIAHFCGFPALFFLSATGRLFARFSMSRPDFG